MARTVNGVDGLSGGGIGQTPVHPDDLEGLRLRWISTQEQLDEVERLNLAEGRRWAVARRRSAESVLDDAFLRKLHERSFGRVWIWAGRYRTRATSIGIDASLVPTATRDALLDARAQLDATRSPAEEDAVLVGTHHAIAWIHPFPNGNGRTARLFVDVLASSCDRPVPTWSQGQRDARQRYLAALRAADDGDMRALATFMWA